MSAPLSTFISRVHGVCQAIRDLPVPVIARVNGFALGGGMEVAAACDMRIVARSARFGMPEVHLGIPSVIEAALLPGLIGFGRARRLVLLGDVVSAEEIADWGFCDELVDDDALDAKVDASAALLECGPQALRLQKELVRRWENLPLSQAVAAGIETFGRAFRSDEPRRLMADFRRAAKRAARDGRPSEGASCVGWRRRAMPTSQSRHGALRHQDRSRARHLGSRCCASCPASSGSDHALAAELWASGIHEARILASMVDDPRQVTAGQMDAWVRNVGSWDLCDHLTGNLFDRDAVRLQQGDRLEQAQNRNS